MTKKRKEPEKEVAVFDCNLEFKMTSEEAYQIVHNKNGKVAKANRKYLNDLLYYTAKACLEKYKEREKERKENL